LKSQILRKLSLRKLMWTKFCGKNFVAGFELIP